MRKNLWHDNNKNNNNKDNFANVYAPLAHAMPQVFPVGGMN
jgi:hypothetical protein